MLQWWQSGMLTELDATGAPSSLFLFKSQIAGIRHEMSGQLQCHGTRQTLLVTRVGEARDGYGAWPREWRGILYPSSRTKQDWPGKIAKLPDVFCQAVRASHLSRSPEAIAVAAHRFQQRLAAWRVDLAAEPGDIEVHDVGERGFAVAPNLSEDAGAREHAARRAHQQLEDGELLGGELDLLAAALDLEQIAIQHKIGNLQDIRPRSEIARSADQRLNAGEQLIEIEGFGEIIVGADAQAFDLVLERVHGGQHQNGRVIALQAQALTDVIAVHVGQHQIQHDHVELSGLGEIDPLGSGGGDGDAVIFGAEPAIDEVGDPRLVFDQQDVHAAPSGGEAGSATVTVVPSPKRLFISILPLWASTMAFATGRPKPKPSSLCSPALPPRRNRSKIPSSSSGAMPIP